MSSFFIFYINHSNKPWNKNSYSLFMFNNRSNSFSNKFWNSTNSTFHNSRQCFNRLFSKCVRASASFVNSFFKALALFDEDDPEATRPFPPPKTPVIATTIVELVVERAVSIDTIVLPLALIKICLHQRHFQWSVWSFQPTFEDLFGFVILFQCFFVA